ncbi:non-specific lipid-transfer protein [Citrus sinensis]|nr:non-specific lipid-transfer protein [Citrus sinensis]
MLVVVFAMVQLLVAKPGEAAITCGQVDSSLARAACDCVKAAAARYPNIKEDAASSLPTKCGVQIGIPISKTTNCAK